MRSYAFGRALEGRASQLPLKGSFVFVELVVSSPKHSRERFGYPLMLEMLTIA